ncbi:NAD(+)/NADH kinase [Actinomyces bowdenii]|uniref:diacylglycerol kinase family protein n=1 Tax=Actinomyces bowdenii TaxID=131109 RepID=UPI00214B5282|nr:diacylglycerol kinase family protein [Actinomyces bowdenii]MCR2052146.1 NAD(+)/NADH kinase [Actinomyces bowdenii]
MAASQPSQNSSAPRSGPLGRLRHVEASLTLGFSLALITWTLLMRAGALSGLDAALHAPDVELRSVTGQVAEAFSVLTHPLLILASIIGWAIYSYKRRMRRLSLALAIAAAGIPLRLLVAWWVRHPVPDSIFADSVSAPAYAYPSAHVTAITLAAWVLVTLARAHRRGSAIVATGTVVGYAAVAISAVSQWLMGLAAPSDLIGGFLMGATVANLALWAGGIESILAAWVNRPSTAQGEGKRAALIYNPTKFDDLSLLRRRIEAETRSAGWEPAIWLETTPEDPGHDMARRALKAGADLVMVAGGDGTVRAASAELAGSGTPMALIPAGTGNLLARNLSIPLDTDAAIRLALHGSPSAIDVVRCEHDGGQERFVVMAGLGLDAQIMDSTDDGLKKVIRSGAYAVAAVQNAVPDPFTATVALDDGEPAEHQIVMALVGNVGTITAGMTLLPSAEPDDGYIDLLLASPDKVADWARLGAQILTGQEMKGFTTARARTMNIRTTEAVAFELDGDPAGTTSALSLEVEPGALLVVMPQDG